MPVTRTLCLHHWPGTTVSRASLPHRRSCPHAACNLARDSIVLRTFILTLSDALCAAHQAEFRRAPRRLAKVVYFRHAAGLLHTAFLLLHTTRLVLRLLLLLQRCSLGPVAGVLPGSGLVEGAQDAF